jgi:hypothetical protein
VEHNLFKEWEKVELELGGHPKHHNAYTNLGLLGWKPCGHHVGSQYVSGFKKNWMIIQRTM